MLIDSNQISREITSKLNSVGVNIHQALVKLILDSEKEVVKDSLIRGDEVCFEGLFTSKVKRRGYRDPSDSESKSTFKISSSIDSSFKSELVFRGSSLNEDD